MANNYNGLSSRAFLLALLAWLLLIAAALPSSAQTAERPAGWTDESHGNRVPANYAIVLPDDRINEIYITFTPESWAAEEADMIEIYGERGANDAGRSRGPGGSGAFARPPQPNIAELAAQLDRSEAVIQAAFALLPDFAAVAQKLDLEIDELSTALGIPAGFQPPGGALDDRPLEIARNPIWVPVTIQMDDDIWTEVGFRYKGNSTLATGWRSGATALPFKLDFDEFEDDHPALDNQRFYGFKQLSFANNAFDSSLQREKVSADIFRMAGVPAAETAFYAVYVDSADGEGYQYWGIYTAIELPDDTLIETQFADDNGNMYKPSGRGASFAAGSFTEEAFDKETNRDTGYDDVLAVFSALHADTRFSDPSAWRSQLETVFDVDGFLTWLATNTLIQNWDTYGVMLHNYYLYADETSGQLVWIPWDNNMALSPSPGLPPDIRNEASESRPAPRGLDRQALSLSMDDVDAEAWPLIGFLMEDPVYAKRYIELVEQVSKNVFTPDRMRTAYENNYQLLAKYLDKTEGADALEALRIATDELIAHVIERAAAAQAFLQTHTAD